MSSATTTSADLALTWSEWRDAYGGELVLPVDALLAYPHPPMLADDLLIAGTLAALVSKPGVGKSFVALDLALSIAAAQPFFLGFPLRLHGPTVYVVGEGGGRFAQRIKAWMQHHHVESSPDSFNWTNGPINLLDDAEVDTFVAAVMEVRPKLVVIDTLSRCLVGADENSQASMTKAVAALDRIRTCVDGMTVLVLHHLNASGSRERGSSVFRGAFDTQLQLRVPKKGEGKGEDESEDSDFGTEPQAIDSLDLVTDKQKDLEELRPIRLQRVEVTINGEFEVGGRPAKSLVIERPDTSLPIKDRLVAFVSRNPGQIKNEIVKAMGGRPDAVYREMAALEGKRIRVEKEGKKHRVYLLNPAA